MIIFISRFGKNIKLGIHEDSSNREKLSELLMFQSTKSGETMVSFKDYIAKMQESQEKIYYITGESKTSVENSPFLEKCKKCNYEVLYMVEPIDEYCVQQLKEVDGKQLVCVTKEGLKFDESEEEKQEWEALTKEFEPLTKSIKNILDSKVEKVTLSERVTDSPCVLVTGEYGWSANMERIMKAQALRDNTMSMHMMSRKTMEINPKNPIIRELKVKQEKDAEDKTLKDLVNLLYESSLINCGFSLDEPSTFVNRINRMIKLGLSLDDEDEEEQEELPPLEEKNDNEEESKMEEVD